MFLRDKIEGPYENLNNPASYLGGQRLKSQP
jgi:hypothetical protein